MSRRHVTILLGAAALGVVFVISGQLASRGPGFTELHRVELPDANDLEVVMGVIERSGESIGTKHYHPGGELGFVLEGSVSMTTESRKSVALEAGASFYQPPGEWHVVRTGSEGARTVVFRVVRKGQPMVVAAD